MKCLWFLFAGYQWRVWYVTDFKTCDINCLTNQLRTVEVNLQTYQNDPHKDSYFQCIYTVEVYNDLNSALSQEISSSRQSGRAELLQDLLAGFPSATTAPSTAPSTASSTLPAAAPSAELNSRETADFLLYHIGTDPEKQKILSQGKTISIDSNNEDLVIQYFNTIGESNNLQFEWINVSCYASLHEYNYNTYASDN
jgi:hypothetical protein